MSGPKVVLITGAASGIGWSTAKAFSRSGWYTVIADLDGGAASARARELEQAHGVSLDVRLPDLVEAVIDECVGRLGRLDALVNNAGIQRHAALESLAFADWQAVLDTNLNGAFHCLQSAGRRMLAQGHGAIVNVASIAANRGAAGRSAYAASKAALVSLTRTAAVEWAERGVRVNAVAPGYVQTELIRHFVDDGRLDLGPILDRTPARRLAEPDEIAQAILFLASPEASFVNGSVLHVDGGFDADYGVPFKAPRE